MKWEKKNYNNIMLLKEDAIGEDRQYRVPTIMLLGKATEPTEEGLGDSMGGSMVLTMGGPEETMPGALLALIMGGGFLEEIMPGRT
jgi:hypothetical protein